MFNHPVTTAKILKVQADKRRAERISSAFSGAVSVNGEFQCHCVIKDVSTSGMRLHLPVSSDLPDEFDIKAPAVPDLMRVRKQWEKGPYLGVSFVNLVDDSPESGDIQQAG